MRVVGSPAGSDASGWSAPCRNSSSASRFSSAHSRAFGSAIDQENFGSSGYGPSPHRMGVSFSGSSGSSARGLKGVDMLAPLGVASKGSEPGGQHVHQLLVPRLRHPWP